MPPVEAKESRISMVRDCSNLSEARYEGVMNTSVTRSTTNGALDQEHQDERKRREEMSYKWEICDKKGVPRIKELQFFWKSFCNNFIKKGLQKIIVS